MAGNHHRSVFGFLELRPWEAEPFVIALVSEIGLTDMVVEKGFDNLGKRPRTEECAVVSEAPASEDSVISRRIVFFQLYHAGTNQRQVVAFDQPCCRKEGCGGPKLVGSDQSTAKRPDQRAHRGAHRKKLKDDTECVSSKYVWGCR